MGDPQPSSSSRVGSATGRTTPARSPWPAFAVVGVVVVAAALVYWTMSGEDSAHTLTGTIALVAPGEITGDPGTCRGTNSFDGFGADMEVTVTDGEGTVLGEGRTENVGDGDGAGDPDDATALRRCVVTFSVPVDDAPEYQIDVGDLATQTFDRAGLEADDWSIVLNLG